MVPSGPTRPMNAEGKAPNRVASSSKRRTSETYQSSARRVAARASGRPARIWSRVSEARGAAIPPGTTPAGWMRLPPIHSITCWPKRRSPTPSRASCGFAPSTPNRCRPLASASKPNSRSGEDRWKKLSAWDCTTWARFMTRRRSAPAGGGSTARISSQALAEAIRWLTGQMPQMRAMIDGSSCTGRPWQMRSKPRNWVTWKRASATWPSSSSWMVILAWPSIRVTGSMTISRATAFASRSGAEAGDVRGVRHPPLQQLVDGEPDEIGRGWAAGQEHVHLDGPVDRHRVLQQPGHDLGRQLGVVGGILQIRPLQQRPGTDRIAHAGDVGGDGTVAERHQGPGPVTDHPDLGQVILAGHGPLDQADVAALGVLLGVDQGAVDQVGPLAELQQPLVHVRKRHVAAGAAVQPDGGQPRAGHGSPLSAGRLR